MARFVTAISGIQPAAVSSNLVIQMDTRRRYHSLDFFVTDAGAAVDIETAISLVTLKVNGKTIRQLTPRLIKRLMAFYNYPQSTGQFTLYFTTPRRRGLLGDELTSWDLFDESSFTVEIKFASSGITAPALFGTQTWDTRRNGEIRDGKFVRYPAFVERMEYTSRQASTVYTSTTELPLGVPIGLLAIVPATAGTVNRVEVTLDNQSVFEGDTLATYGNQNPYQSYDDYGLVTDRSGTQNFVPVAFDVDDKLESAITVTDSQNIKVFLASAQAIDILRVYRTSSFA